jgi:hypothetical protein
MVDQPGQIWALGFWRFPYQFADSFELAAASHQAISARSALYAAAGAELLYGCNAKFNRTVRPSSKLTVISLHLGFLLGEDANHASEGSTLRI